MPASSRQRRRSPLYAMRPAPSAASRRPSEVTATLTRPLSWDPEFQQIVSGAVERLSSDIARLAPGFAIPLHTWMAALAGSSNPAGYFLCGRGSFLSFAWYLERSFRPEIDVQFQSDLAYSSVSAYYFVRLVDDVV